MKKFIKDEELNEEFKDIIEALKGKNMNGDLKTLENIDVRSFLASDSSGELKDYSLLENLTQISSHRKGLLGRMASFVLRKFYFVLKSMLKDVLLQQERINRELFHNVKGLKNGSREMNRELKGNSKWIKSTRDEFFAELKFKGAGEVEFENRILNPKKVESMEKKRLNLGSGIFCFDDYINVDMRELEGVDIVAKVDDLPFEEASLVKEEFLHKTHYQYSNLDYLAYFEPHATTLEN